MASVVIVSGCPGSGKTTLCRSLAAADKDGLHLVSDTFYEFISHRVDPTKPESQHQNAVIMQALARSARTFADGGYTVYLDGVVGPWFLHIFRPSLESDTPTSYIVLQTTAAEAQARVRSRQGEGLRPIVFQMQRSLADLGPLGHHAIETTGRSESEILAGVSKALSSGTLELDWSLVEA